MIREAAARFGRVSGESMRAPRGAGGGVSEEPGAFSGKRECRNRAPRACNQVKLNVPRVEMAISWLLLKSIDVAGAVELISSGDRQQGTSAPLIFLKDLPALASGRLRISIGTYTLERLIAV